MADNLRFQLDVDTTAAVGSINDFFNTFASGAAQAKSKLNSAFGQGVQTEIKVEFKNGELVAKQVQAVNQESKRLGDIFDAVNGKVAKTPAELRKSISILRELRDNTAKFNDATGKLNKDWQVLTEKINKAKQALNDITKGNGIQQLGNAIQGLAGRFALVQTLSNALQGAIQGIVKGSTEFVTTGERLNLLSKELAAFTGSSEKAAATFAEFQKTAASTKFNVEQVAQAGKILLAYGIDAETAADATNRLSIVASATGGDVELLARNLGQTASQGRAYTRDLTQFAIQGIPIWEELAKVTGKSTDEVKKLATEGAIGFREVQQALENMTAEGSAFALIADQVQNTYTGALRQVESAVQNLALQFVQVAEATDKAFGGLVINSIKLIGGIINALANNWRTITTLIVAASVATATFVAISNFGTIVNVIKGLVTAYQTWRASISAAAVAQAVLQGLLGNWAAIAAGLAAGTVVAIGLNEAFKNQAIEAAKTEAEVSALAASTGTLSQAELQLAEAAGKGVLVEKYKAAAEKQKEYAEALDTEKKKLQELQTQVNEKFNAEKQQIKDKLQTAQDALSEEKQALSDLKSQIKDRYDAEKTQLQEKLQLVRDIYDEEIGRLQEITPAEAALREYRKQEIQDKLAAGGLSQKETLELQAQLERMERQDKIRELQLEKNGKVAKIQEQIKDNEDKYKKSIEEVTKASEGRQNALIAEINGYKEEIKGIEAEQKVLNDRINEAIKGNQDLSVTVDDLKAKTELQIVAVNNAATAFNNQKAAADELAKSIREVAAAQRELNAAKGGAQSNGSYENGRDYRFAGGPVTGGGTYTVNELGKEAFLSASGKLSMINAPSWGEWRAPGAGTVIPAHLTSKLDIPSGGINLNSAVKSSAARAGGENSSSKLLRAISGLGGGNVNNTVTIQAANTTKAASDILVELTKIKRRRYS